MINARTAQIFYLGFGTILFLGLWQAIGYYKLAGTAWPPLTDVLAYALSPLHRVLFVNALLATLKSAGLGYVIGAAIGITLALVGNLVPALRKGADRANAWIHAIPMIAVGPIFMLLLGIGAAPVAMAAFGVVFIFYVAVTSGFALASKSHADVMTVLGANRYARLVHLTLPAAMPAIVTGIKLALPRAGLGAILGEWFGASRGIGVLMVTGMQEFQMPLLWSASLLMALSSLLFFGLGSGLERFVEGRFR